MFSSEPFAAQEHWQRLGLTRFTTAPPKQRDNLIGLAMARFTKRKRAERAHRYRVLAQQLDFHLSTESMGPNADRHVRAAKEALIDAASVLEQEIGAEMNEPTAEAS